jgi:SAM-dependent methyltransferase
VRLLGLFVRSLAALAGAIGRFFDRAAFTLNGLLPALLPPQDLTGLIRAHYDRGYRGASTQPPDDCYTWTLEQWEADVFIRHGAGSRRMLVLGCGTGRESIALAKLGHVVVGLDINRDALLTAANAARRLQVSGWFIQGDFLAMPVGARLFDCLLLSGIMYSSVPGRGNRLAWLRSLRAHLRPGGCIVLNFLVDRWPSSRSRRLVIAVNRLVAALPGANRTYQPGDTCAQGHFLHAFRDEGELRQELLDAGITVAEIDWSRGYAVVQYGA